MVKKYKTKPCEIEAIQWTGDNIDEVLEFTEGNAYLSQAILKIRTLEGDMEAKVTDYIIRGLRGEYYPCKEDVFHKKYEEV